MTEIHGEAWVCPSCGAKKGVWGPGFTRRQLESRAAIVAAIGLLPLVIGFGFLIKGEAVGFMLLAGLSLIPFAAAAAILVISTSKEKWYR